MNKKSLLMTGRCTRTLTLAAMAVLSLSACTQQQLQQTQAELAVANSCVVAQQEQAQTLAAQQAKMIEQLQKVQLSLDVQQTMLAERPQVIQMTQPKVDCPPPPPEKFLSSQPLLSDKQIVGADQYQCGLFGYRCPQYPDV